jgi:hypothetical protein
MARQVDDMQRAMRAQRIHQRREDAAVHRPAMQQDQRWTAADHHLHAQAHAASPRRGLAVTQRIEQPSSMCATSASCAAQGDAQARLPSGHRRRADRRDPVAGVRSSAAAIASASASSLPNSTGWIGVSDGISCSRVARAVAEAFDQARNRSRRQCSRRAMRTAARVAAACAGGSAVV